MITSFVFLGIAAFAAGIVNTIAGGGSFMVFPALMLTGLDPRAANITSTLALYPMQVSTGFSGRKFAGGTPHLSFKSLLIISLVGGVIGAFLLLMTPSEYFKKIVPWLVMFATIIFAWGSFRKKPKMVKETRVDHLGSLGAGTVQFAISVYGGYFGGGIGLMMLAALTYAGMHIRQATTTKNILAAVMNTSAVAVFLFSDHIHWVRGGIVAVCAVAGGIIGVKMLERVNETFLRLFIVATGVIVTIAMFWKY